MQALSFTRKTVQPFRLDFTSWALQRLSQNIVDRYQNGEYRRAIFIENQIIEITVTQPRLSEGLLRVHLRAKKFASPAAVRQAASLVIDRLLGPKIDLNYFYRSFDKYPKIGMLIQEFRGLKPPRFPSVFEALVNAFSCQQVSLNVGLLLLNSLAVNYGRSMKVEGNRVYAFPTADTLAMLSDEELRKLGFSTRKSEYIIQTAKLVSNEKMDLESISGMNEREAIEFLSQLKGVGRWTAEYALLRGAGRIDVFPADDIGGQNGLRSLLTLGGNIDYNRVNRLTSKWQPYDGLIYFHLLLRRLKKGGYLG